MSELGHICRNLPATGTGSRLAPECDTPFTTSIDDVPFQPTPPLPRRLLASFALLAACACQGDAAGDGGRRASTRTAAAANPSISDGEVVIAVPRSPYRVSNAASPGSVTGTVALRGAPASRPAISTGKDGAMCGASIADESLKAQGGGLASAVVWLDGLRTGKPLGLERRVELESDHCRLVPRVQAAVVGSAVNILGHDDFRQHLQFSAAGDSAPRATILLGGGEQVIPTELPFRSPGMVTVSDRDHPWTRAYLAVFDHPYFAVTAANGSFTIDGVPPGSYTLHAWHERTGVAEQKVDVGASGVVTMTLTLEAK